MKTHARVLAAGAGLALAIWMVAVADSSAADEKNARDTILKMADLIEKKDDAGAKNLAQKIAKDVELHEVMEAFALRSKKGLGFGAKAGAVTPDGIEAQLIGLARKPRMQKEVDAQAADLAKAAYVAAAVADFALLNKPAKNEGMKKIEDWVKWSNEMRSSAVQLAEAAKAKKPDAIKSAASSLNSACNNCHGVFRD